MVKKEKAWNVEPRTLLDIVAHNEHKLLAASLEDSKEDVVAFRDKYGVSALHTAALYNHLVLAKTLIEAEVNLDAQTDVGTTSLHLAAELGHYEMVVQLIDAGANPAILNDQFEMPLQLARRNKHSRIVVLLEPLVEPLTSKSKNALEAATVGDVLYLVNLVDTSKLPEGEIFVSPSELTDVSEQNETLLTTIVKQDASEEGGGVTEAHMQTLDFILTKQLVNVNRTNGSKLTALMVAVKGGYFPAAMMLLKHGADPTLCYDEEEENSTASSLTQDPEMALFLTAEERKFTFDTQLALRNTIAFEARSGYIKEMKQHRKEMRIAARALDQHRRKKAADEIAAQNASLNEETEDATADGARSPLGASGRAASGPASLSASANRQQSGPGSPASRSVRSTGPGAQ